MKGDPPQASKVRQSRRLRKKKEQREEMAIEKAKRKQQKQKKKMRMKNARTQQKKAGRGKNASAPKTTTKNKKTGERKRKKQSAATSTISLSSWIDPSITPQPRSNRIAPVPLATLEGVCMRPGIRGTQTAGRLAAYARTIIFTGDKGGSVRTSYFPPTMIFIFPVASLLHLSHPF